MHFNQIFLRPFLVTILSNPPVNIYHITYRPLGIQHLILIPIGCTEITR